MRSLKPLSGSGLIGPGSDPIGTYSILAPGTGHGFRQDRVDFIQHLALIGTFWESLLVDTFFAGAFHQIADFEIIFVFECFFWHLDMFQ